MSRRKCKKLLVFTVITAIVAIITALIIKAVREKNDCDCDCGFDDDLWDDDDDECCDDCGGDEEENLPKSGEGFARDQDFEQN
jgi:hypothetical protein